MAGKVLISGGAGFVASHLCDRFLNDGWQVLAVDNFCTGRLGNVAHLLHHPRFSFLEQDVSLPFTVTARWTPSCTSPPRPPRWTT